MSSLDSTNSDNSNNSIDPSNNSADPNIEIKNAISKLIDIQHSVDVQMSIVSIQSNSLDTGSGAVIARGNSNITLDQSNKLKQNVEVVIVYQMIADANMTNNELFVTQAIRDTFDGFYTDDYIKSVLELPETSEIMIDYDTKMLEIRYASGEVEKIPLSLVEDKLAANFKYNEKIFEENFLSHKMETKMKVETALSATQTNRRVLENVKFLDSSVAWKQTNNAIQDLLVRLDAITGMNTNQGGKINVGDSVGNSGKGNGKVEDVGYIKSPEDEKDQKDQENKSEDPGNEGNEENIKDEKDEIRKVLFIIIIIFGICLLSAVLMIVFIRPTYVNIGNEGNISNIGNIGNSGIDEK